MMAREHQLKFGIVIVLVGAMIAGPVSGQVFAQDAAKSGLHLL